MLAVINNTKPAIPATVMILFLVQVFFSIFLSTVVRLFFKITPCATQGAIHSHTETGSVKGIQCQHLTFVVFNKLQNYLPTKMFVTVQKLSAFDTPLW